MKTHGFVAGAVFGYAVFFWRARLVVSIEAPTPKRREGKRKF